MSVWTPPAAIAPGQIPTAAHFEFHYDMDRKQFELSPGEITTPSSRIQFRGALSAVDSSIDMTVDTDDLMPWDDFINRLRGPTVVPASDRRPVPLGRATDRPSWRPHVHGTLQGDWSAIWLFVLGRTRRGAHLFAGRDASCPRPRAQRPVFRGDGARAGSRQLGF